LEGIVTNENGAARNTQLLGVVEDVVATLRRLQAGERNFVLRAVAARLDDRELDAPIAAALPLLSARERQIFALVVDGHTTAEIAHALCISGKTVDTHRGHIFKKLGVHSAAALVRLAARAGILDAEAPKALAVAPRLPQASGGES
jgi:DNA-binding CsgD family transcriptional regulator